MLIPGLAKPGFLVFAGFLVFWFNHGFIRISPQTLIKPNLENARETAETAGNGRNGRRRSAQSTFELEPRGRILMSILNLRFKADSEILSSTRTNLRVEYSTAVLKDSKYRYGCPGQAMARPGCCYFHRSNCLCVHQLCVNWRKNV